MGDARDTAKKKKADEKKKTASKPAVKAAAPAAKAAAAQSQPRSNGRPATDWPPGSGVASLRGVPLLLIRVFLERTVN